VVAVVATGSVSTVAWAAKAPVAAHHGTHHHVVATDSDNMKSFTLRHGDTLTVVLHGGWTIQGSSDPTVLRQQGPPTPGAASASSFRCPPNAMCATPAETATFTARAPGSATVSATKAPQCPPGAMCPMFVMIYRLQVTVTR
jgi:hypothetical protein